MLYPGKHGQSLVSEEFNQMCVDNNVEVTVKALPNPGNPYQAVRMLEFKSFTDSVIRVTQYDHKNTVHNIPARGSIQMVLGASESLPLIEKVPNV